MQQSSYSQASSRSSFPLTTSHQQWLEDSTWPSPAQWELYETDQDFQLLSNCSSTGSHSWVPEWREKASMRLYHLAPTTSCRNWMLLFISVGKRTFQDQPVSGTWVSPFHIKARGRRGISGGTLSQRGSMQAPRHTCTGLLGICSLRVLEEVGKLRLEQTLRINAR